MKSIVGGISSGLLFDLLVCLLMRLLPCDPKYELS